MSLFPTYKQQGALASGLLNKGFPSTDSYEFSIELAAPASGGLTVSPSLTKSSSGAIEGAISTTYAESGNRFVSRVDLKEDFSLNYAHPGFKLGSAGVLKPTVDVSMKIRESDAVKVKPSFELRHESFSLTGGVNFQPLKAIFFASPAFTFLTGSLSRGLSVGADVAFVNSQLSTVNSLIAYNASPLEATIFSKTSITKDNTKCHSIGGTYYQALTGKYADVSVGGEAVVPLDNPSRPTLTIGASKLLNAFASVKGRVNSRGLLGFSYSQKMNSPVQLIVSSELNINEINSSNPFRYGIKLIFG